jgi:hypothetical protein
MSHRGLHVLVQGNGLVQQGPRILFVAVPGQHGSQVLQRGGQFHRRADRPVVRHRFREPVRIGLEHSVTPQTGRGRPGGPGLSRGLVPARLRRVPRGLPIADGEREPDKVGKPLVG